MNQIEDQSHFLIYWIKFSLPRDEVVSKGSNRYGNFCATLKSPSRGSGIFNRDTKVASICSTLYLLLRVEARSRQGRLPVLIIEGARYLKTCQLWE